MTNDNELTRADLALLGAERCKWRRRLQEVMDKKNTNPNKLAKTLGFAPNTVYGVLTGRLHTSAVLDWLRENGAEEKYLCDPRKRKEAA